MNPNLSLSDEEKRRANAVRNSRIVSRRAAFGMALRQAFSAYRGVKDKAVNAAEAVGVKLAGPKKDQEGPPQSGQD